MNKDKKYYYFGIFSILTFIILLILSFTLPFTTKSFEIFFNFFIILLSMSFFIIWFFIFIIKIRSDENPFLSLSNAYKFLTPLILPVICTSLCFNRFFDSQIFFMPIKGEIVDKYITSSGRGQTRNYVIVFTNEDKLYKTHRFKLYLGYWDMISVGDSIYKDVRSMKPFIKNEFIKKIKDQQEINKIKELF